MEAGHQPEQARPCICACAAAKKAKVTILAGDDAPVAESEGVEESEEAEEEEDDDESDDDTTAALLAEAGT